MRVGIQTGGIISRFDIDKTFALIKEAGFDCVDYNLDIYHKWDDIINARNVYPFRTQDEWIDYINEIKAASNKYGVAIGQMHAPFPGFVKQSEEGTEMIQECIRMSVEACGLLGCSKLVVHPCFDGSARYPMPKEREVTENEKLYTSLIPLLKKYHVICCLENMWIQDWETKHIYFGCCSNVDEAISYIDHFNELAGEKCFGFCMDTGHLLLLGIDNYEFITKLGDRLVALHVHDNDGRSDGHTAPYIGVCNWERFINGLKAVNFNGDISFETASSLKRVPDDLVASSISYVHNIGRYLERRIQA
ncbi:MAG: sugar phosphate isomerase/epimerase, partial [Clostridia bacterium]|nr:sugar phosphate isomerase/epimerase [Clostridia bacterium]